MLRLLLLHPASAELACREDVSRGDARALYEGVRAALDAGAGDTAAVLDRLDGALREQAGLLLDWGADLPEAPAFRPAEEVDAGVRHLRLLNHHREVGLIGARRAELDRAGDRGDWAAEAARVAALAAGIRRLEREGASLHSTNWAAARRVEASAARHPTA